MKTSGCQAGLSRSSIYVSICDMHACPEEGHSVYTGQLIPRMVYAKVLVVQVDRVIGDRKPSMADLKQLPFTTRVINESMRLYPQPPVLIRYNMNRYMRCKSSKTPPGHAPATLQGSMQLPSSAAGVFVIMFAAPLLPFAHWSE